MTAPIRPGRTFGALPPADQARIRANLAKMQAQHAPDADVDAYLSEVEHLDPVGESAGPAAAPVAAPVAPAPRVAAPAPPKSSVADIVQGVARAFLGQGVAAGFGDELEAAATSVVPGPGGIPFVNPVAYVGNRDQIRAQQQRFSRDYPGTAATAEVAGGLAGAFLPVGAAARGATAAERLAQAARTGATFGALAGFGKGEGGAGAQALSAAEGAGAGALLGGGVQGAGEVGRKLAQAASASPRLLGAAANAAPAGSRVRDFLARRAQAARDAVVDRNVLERLAQDRVTPGQALRVVQDAPESIPVALADVGDENVRQAFAAVKRLPGPQKADISRTVDARDAAAPAWMRRAIRAHTANDAAALGLDPAAVDVRSANPNDVARAAGAARGARDAQRYGRTLGGASQWDPGAVDELSTLLRRPSMRQAASFARSLAGEEGANFGKLVRPTVAADPDATAAALDAAHAELARIRAANPPSRTGLPTSSEELGAMQGVIDAYHAHEAALAAPEASGPTPQQLHYLKMGHDRVVGALKAEAEDLRRKGADAGKVSTQLQKAMATHRQLLDLIDQVVPGYGETRAASAAEAAPIGAFQQGRRLSTSALPEDVQTQLAQLPNDNARTALGAGYARQLQNAAAARRANPVRAVVGTGAPDDPVVENLRALLPAAAPGIEQDAALVARIKRTNAAVKGNSATAERLTEDAAQAQGLIKKIVGVTRLARGRLGAVGDIFGGTYGPDAAATANRFLLGATPGQREALVRYLMQLEQSSTAQRLAVGTRRRPLGALAGQAAGSLAAGLNAP